MLCASLLPLIRVVLARKTRTDVSIACFVQVLAGTPQIARVDRPMRLRLAAGGSEAAVHAREWGADNTGRRRRPLVPQHVFATHPRAQSRHTRLCFAKRLVPCRWLTELSLRKTEAEKAAEPQPKADEDGPPSSDGGQEEVNDFTDDDDESMSGSSEPPPEAPKLTPPSENYTGFFERQRQVTS